jgi:hypothetical protein
MTWSADFPADDWRRIGARQVMARALSRLEAKGRGVLLLHDIQPATALALPGLLKELKARGYRIVHVVPATASRVKTATTSDEWMLRGIRKSWPRTAADLVSGTQPELAAPVLESFGIAAVWPSDAPLELTRGYLVSEVAASLELLPATWPGGIDLPAIATSASLPIPSILTLALRYQGDTAGAEPNWPASPVAHRATRRTSVIRATRRRAVAQNRSNASAARRQPEKPSGMSGLLQSRYGE